ncbi:MAG: zinc ribbon domain-containing protein [Thermoflexales bacterium]|nr:zinc ribbon domain-containing protein [Thermoflexales bacterium]
MPIYEYTCEDCEKKFDALRPMSKADAPIDCKHCHSKHTSRLVSVFAAHSKTASGSVSTIAGGSGGGGCASCSSHSCATCGAH